MPRPKPTGAILEASHECVALFVERGTVNVTVAELVARARISERTFYRFFATKEASIRPVLEEALGAMVSSLGARPVSEPLETSIVAAFEEVAVGPFHRRTRGLMALFTESDVLRAIWRSVVRDSVDALAVPLAARLGEPPSARRVMVLATTVTSLAQLALESTAASDANPVTELRDNLGCLGPEIFRARTL